jgi:putative effector of murein hydrolase
LSYDDYVPGKDALGWLLGPATVALAVLVHSRRAWLKSAAMPLLCGVVFGSLSTIAAVLLLATLGGVEASVQHALAFKSVTAAVAVELARLHGGDPSLAAIFVNMTGILGAMFGPYILTRCHVTDAVARGVALGTTSHALGTAAALLEDPTSGTTSSLAMAGAAVWTTAIAPVYIPWLLAFFGA